VDQAVNASARIEFRQALSESQLAQALAMVSTSSLSEPQTSLKVLLLLRRRHRITTKNKTEARKRYEQLQDWNRLQQSSILLLRGSFKQRQKIKELCLDVIEYLERRQVGVLWALKNITLTDKADLAVSDVLKGLIAQALRINCASYTDLAFSHQLRRFIAARTEEDWFDLLGSIIEQLPMVYIVFDLELVRQLERNSSIAWYTGFSTLLVKLRDRDSKCIVKIILACYGPHSPLDKVPNGQEQHAMNFSDPSGRHAAGAGHGGRTAGKTKTRRGHQLPTRSANR
jgi:hypothetical protein